MTEPLTCPTEITDTESIMFGPTGGKMAAAPHRKGDAFLRHALSHRVDLQQEEVCRKWGFQPPPLQHALS